MTTRRKVATPGAPEKAPAADTTPIGATESDPKGEKATGVVSEAPQDQSTNETSSPCALVEDERLDQILEGQKRIEKKLDALLKAGKVEAPKKQRWVQGKHGFELKEA